MPNAMQRRQAQDKVSKGTASKVSRKTQKAIQAEATPPEAVAAPLPETVEPKAVVDATTKRKPSIRQLVTDGIQAGKSTKDIEAELKAAFPDSQAAQKSAKHIAFYRCQLKRAKKA